MRQLRVLFGTGTVAGLTDAQLLRRYTDRRAEAAGASADAEAAFAALVDRHGPMVWGVCRRALGDVHEAEDAFQATFVILARRAGTVWVDGSLGRWLYGVARRVAGRARAERLRRRAREGSAETEEPARSAPDAEKVELLAAVDEELGRLPEKYREPMVLCHLEGLTYAGAAERLGWPTATVKGRLTKARALLRARLTRRGLGLPAAALGTFAATEARAAVPAALAEKAVRAASTLARSATAAGASATAFTLASGVIRTMLVIRLTKVVTLLALASAGTWLLAGRAPAPEAAAHAAAPPEREPRPPAGPDDPGSAIAVPLPEPDTLRRLLRRAAEESIALARKQPDRSSLALATIAKAQATSGDPDGARETFRAAVHEAGGDFGGRPDVQKLHLVARNEVEAGFPEDARRTLQRALDAAPGVTADLGEDISTVRNLAAIVEEQASAGALGEARRAADRLRAFTRELFGKPGFSNAEAIVAPEIASAMAAVGDFAAAFERAGDVRPTDSVLGAAALSAAKHLDREAARRFVDEAAARMDRLVPADKKSLGRIDLAEAQARIGEVAAAKLSARAVGELQTYALLRIAKVQQESGDIRGARETRREGYQVIVDHPEFHSRATQMRDTARTQVEAGDIEDALITAGAMPGGERYRLLALIARAQAIRGDRAAAATTLARALEDAPNADQVRQNPLFSADEQFAELRAMAGDVAGALKTIKAISHELHRKLALQRVVSARATAGDVAGALRLALEESQSPDERRDALQGLGQGVEDRLRQESLTPPAK